MGIESAGLSLAPHLHGSACKKSPQAWGLKATNGLTLRSNP